MCAMVRGGCAQGAAGGDPPAFVHDLCGIGSGRRGEALGGWNFSPAFEALSLALPGKWEAVG